MRVAKLRSIAEAQLDLSVEADQGQPFADGAGLFSNGHAALLVGKPSRRSLGPAISWAAQQSENTAQGEHRLTRLDLVLDPSVPTDDPSTAGGSPSLTRLGATETDSVEGVRSGKFGLATDDARSVGQQLARIGQLFAPEVRVWVVEGTEVVEVSPAPAPSRPAAPWAEAADLVALLADVGLELSPEPGMVLGEVAGLEVARVTLENGEPHVAVGVGRFDQEMSAVAQSELRQREAIERAADLVRLARTTGGTTHPMARLARERSLRAHLIDQPGLVGASALAATPGLWVRHGLRTPMPAAALGTDESGRALIVVCSAGVDTDLVPAALELAAETDPAARVVLALSEADVVPSTRRVAALAVTPPEIVTVAPPWEPAAEPR